MWELIAALCIAFAFGTNIGSFLNVVILRFNAGVSLSGRSACPMCARPLPWYTLIPILSFCFQMGKCRNCHGRISMQYPLIELLTGLAFSGVVYVLGVPMMFSEGLVFGVLLIIVSLLIIILGYDLRHMIIPNRFVYAFALLALLLLFIQTNGMPTGWELLAGPILFAPFWVLWWVSGGSWIGLGDGKVALGIGWLLGLSAGTSAILVAVWAGALVGLLIMSIAALQRAQPQLFMGAKRRTIQSEIPFAPFLVISTMVHIAVPIDVFQLIYALSL